METTLLHVSLNLLKLQKKIYYHHKAEREGDELQWSN